MSAVQLQRLVVRMLHDPQLVAAVYESPETALADEEVTATERTWILAQDRRRFTADPLRPRRVLKGLLDEYKGSAALLVGATRRVASLDRFFASTAFHAAIRQRRALAPAFGDYLATEGAALDPRIAAVARLEQAFSRARRGRAPSTARLAPVAADAVVMTAPHLGPVRVPGGTLAVLQAVEQVLFEISLTPVAALAEDGPTLAAVPALAGDDELYLAVGDGKGAVTLEPCAPLLLESLLVAVEPVDAGRLAWNRPDDWVSRLVNDRLVVVAAR